MRRLRYDSLLAAGRAPIERSAMVARLCDPPNEAVAHLARATERWFEKAEPGHPKPTRLWARLTSGDDGDWWSAWWELVAGQLLTDWGALVHFEPELNGKTPDLSATDASGEYVVEVFALREAVIERGATAQRCEPATATRLFGRKQGVVARLPQNRLRVEGRRVRERLNAKLAAYQQLQPPLVVFIGLCHEDLWHQDVTEALIGPSFVEGAGPAGLSPLVGRDGALSNEPTHPRVRRLAGVVSARWAGADSAGVYIHACLHPNRWRDVPTPRFFDRPMRVGTLRVH